jgi:hypothetical protein
MNKLNNTVKLARMDCNVIYGFIKDLQEWHMIVIVPTNFAVDRASALTAISQASALATINLNAVSMALPAQIRSFTKGEKIPLFFTSKF